MAKEKIQEVEIKATEKIFHYEILGIILLIVSMLAIAKLGLVGLYLCLIIKVLFGDWYFLIILLIIAYGIRCILVHRTLKIHNIRYLGIFLIILSLILLSHFSFNSVIEEYDDNLLKLTFKLYFNFFKSKNFDAISGGGMIGATIFYIFLTLFSKIGVILLSVILIFLGVVFISKKTIKDFILSIIKVSKKVIEIIKKTKGKFSKISSLYDKTYHSTKVKYKITKVDNSEIYNNECMNAKATAEIIKKILNNMNVFYNEINYLVCRNITIYFIKSYYQFSYSIFSSKFKQYVSDFSIKFDQTSNELLLEVNNLYSVPLRIYEVNEEINKDEILFGIDDRNEYLKLNEENNSMLIIGENHSLISSYLDAIIIGSKHFNKDTDYEFLDLYFENKLATGKEFDLIDIMITKLNNRISKMTESKINSFEEFLNNNGEKRIIYIIHGIDKIINNPKYLDKLIYLLENSHSSGIYLIFSISKDINDINRLFNQFKYKLYFDKMFSKNNKMINDLSFKSLNPECEGFLQYKSIIIRMTLLRLGKEELKK